MSKLNWRSMIAVLSTLTEDELKQVLDVELETYKRPAIARRLHQRYSAMRTARERGEIMRRLKK
jgi:hypothetical protein